jgi:O-antigen/teichoic acid export membrane protein
MGTPMTLEVDPAEPGAATAAAAPAPPTDAAPDGRPDLRRAAARGAASVVAVRLGMQLLSVAATFFVARLLRPYDYGVLTTSSLFVNLADVLATAGLGAALVQRRDLGEDAAREVFAVTLVFSAALTLIVVAAAPAVAAFFQTPELVRVLYVTAPVLLLNPFRTVGQALLERRLQLGRTAAIYGVFTTLQLCFVVGAALAGLGYWSLVLGYCLARSLETGMLMHQARWRPALRWPGPESRALLGFGARSMGSNLLWIIYSQSDFAVAGRLLGPHLLGAYSLAFQTVSIPANRLSAALGQVSYTVFCRMQEQPERMRDWYLRLVRVLAATGMPFLVGLALVAADAVEVVLGPRWRAAVLPIRLLCVPGYVLYINATFYGMITARGRPDLPMRYNAAYALLLPPLFLAGGLARGLVGICLVWTIAYPIIAATFVALSRPVVGFGLRDLARCHVPTLKASAAMALAVLAFQRFALPGGPGLARLAGAVAVGAVTYVGAIWVLERETVFRDLGTLLRDLKG